jgi:nucleoside-diphosphate-sugar epimerase
MLGPDRESKRRRRRVIRKPVVLITGASGEIGHGLIDRIAQDGSRPIVTLDLMPLEPKQAALVQQQFSGSILDDHLLERILSEYEVELVFHLAALLSTRSEFTPTTAHQVNVEGTMRLLEFAQKEGESHGRPVVFLYPSSIAAYGLPDLETKARAGRVSEDVWNTPSTMYGCNKLYCEQLGRYYSRHYKQLAAETLSGRVDFRSVRFPGLISAVTSPSGGTSDYAPEMLHAAARRQPYACFVRPDTRIPFMAMPDGVDALLRLASAPKASLSRTVYNVGAFNPSAEEIRARVLDAFPGAEITFAPDEKRQRIVDSWPADVDDSAARRDWGFAPRYDEARAFSEYLVPTIRGSYR